MAETSKKLHIAMLPWLAFGHIIPFLEKRPSHFLHFNPSKHRSSPSNPTILSSFHHFRQIQSSKTQKSPRKLGINKRFTLQQGYVKIASDHLQKPITNFFKESAPDWIIYDFVTYWLGPLARKHGLLSAYFIVCPAVILCYFGSPKVILYGDGSNEPQDFTKKPKWVPFESQVRPSLFQLTRVQEMMLSSDEKLSDTYRFGSTIDGCDVVLVKSCFEFEPEWFNLIKQLYEKPVIPVGLLPATGTDRNANACWLETKLWLDKHEKGTVVYIAFRTETKPSQYELTQLALGLELSELPFYWVLIDQLGSSDDEVTKLPHGFEERTSGRGVVCRSWAPQFKILSHDSLGGLLIHSGTSSVVEGLQLGKPLVLLPFIIDQGIMASYLVEKKMACMVNRDEVDGSFEPESVAESLNLVMVKQEGKVYRDKAKEMMSLIGSTNVQDKYLQELMAFLQNYQ